MDASPLSNRQPAGAAIRGVPGSSEPGHPAHLPLAAVLHLRSATGGDPSCLVPLHAGAETLDHDGQESQDREHPVITCLHDELLRSRQAHPWCSPSCEAHRQSRERVAARLDGCPMPWTHRLLKPSRVSVDIAPMLIGAALVALHPLGAAGRWPAVGAGRPRVPPLMARRGRARGPGPDHLDPARRRPRPQ